MYEPNPLFGGIRKMVGLGRTGAAKVDVEDQHQQQFLAAQPPDDEPSSESPVVSMHLRHGRISEADVLRSRH
jgi:hypothetical protein